MIFPRPAKLIGLLLVSGMFSACGGVEGTDATLTISANSSFSIGAGSDLSVVDENGNVIITIGVDGTSSQSSSSSIPSSSSEPSSSSSSISSSSLSSSSVSSSSVISSSSSSEPEVVLPGDFQFRIIDADHNVVVDINDGDELAFDSLPEFFNIEVLADETYKSVRMGVFTDNYTVNRVEESPIWTMNAESEGFKGPIGSYTLEATAYTEDGAKGLSSDTFRVFVTFVEEKEPEPVPYSVFRFQLTDENDNVLGTLVNGQVLKLSSLPSFFNVEAATDETFASVRVAAESEDSFIERTEEEAIWTIYAGDKGFKTGAGTYTFKATGYSKDKTQGDVSETSSITVTFQQEGIVEGNLAPVAASDRADTTSGSPLYKVDVLKNDSDPENAPLTLVEASASSGGDVEVSDNKITFYPDSGYIGTVVITYKVSDGENTSVGTLTVNVLGVPQDVGLTWEAPTQRMSGAPLALSEIKGYEVMYRRTGSSNYSKVFVSNSSGSKTMSTNIKDLTAKEYEFLIATVDMEGVYSNFTPALVVNIQ